MDIEGAEGEILAALERIDERPPFISIEAGNVDSIEVTQGLYRLHKMGYRKYKILQQATIPGSILRTRDLNGHEFQHVFPDDSSGAFGNDLSGPWLDYDTVLTKLRVITRRQKLFGRSGLLENVRGGWRLVRLLERAFGRALVGWHDIHAAL